MKKENIFGRQTNQMTRQKTTKQGKDINKRDHLNPYASLARKLLERNIGTPKRGFMKASNGFKYFP